MIRLQITDYSNTWAEHEAGPEEPFVLVILHPGYGPVRLHILICWAGHRDYCLITIHQGVQHDHGRPMV